MVTEKNFRIIFIVFFLCLSLFSCKKNNDFKDGIYTYVLGDSKILLKTDKKKDGFYVALSKNDQDCLIKFKITDADNINLIIDKNYQNVYLLNSGYMDKVLKNSTFLHLVNDKDYDSLFFEKQIRSEPKILKKDFTHISIITMNYLMVIDKNGIQKRIR